MKRIYFSINEELAKRSHDMMSFRDYAAGSKTAEYQEYVNKAYDLADMVVEAKPDQAERVYGMAERYAKKLADNMNKASSIGCMCPSVMITGGSNFPVHKKEKQSAAADKNYVEFKEIQGILKKMRNILYGREQIKSGDEDAIEKLEGKLENLKDLQEKMKAANKAIRLKDEKKGGELLKDMGYTEEQIKELRTPDFCGRIGYPDYALQNNKANIHRVEERLKELKAAKEKGTLESKNQFFKVVENTETMRLQLFFEDKPEPEIREVLKSNSFRWAPSQEAWQRQLTSNARYSLKRVIEQLKKMQEANAE